jgi:uncharacterized protein YecT (DUF1311 family)
LHATSHIHNRCAQAKKTNRYKMKLTLTAILFCFLNLAFGQTDKEHPIDTELQNCLDTSENYTTKGMTDCVVQATEKWDLELNKNYQKLLNLLTAEQKEKLKITQREWVEYRDKEIEFSNQLYYDMQGTMWIPVAAQTKLDLTRKRTVELKNYIANLTIDN